MSGPDVFPRAWVILYTVLRVLALQQLSELKCAPSVGMHDVPRESLGQHLGFRKDEEEGRDELDEHLARRLYHFSNPVVMH